MEKRLKRGAGILLPISSLPSPYGIGSFGKAAYNFADELKAAGQTYWQVLPVGPTSYGDSPYQSFSAFAGNPYFIDLDTLAEEGLLKKSELKKIKWCEVPDYVSYEIQWDHRFKVLRKAFSLWKKKPDADFVLFCDEEKAWLEDYALFMAVKSSFDNHEWLLWDEDIRFRRAKGLKKYRELLKEDIEFQKFLQYKFFTQWRKLKKYVNDLGISIIGDIPIYVALDSSDVWANRELFQLSEDGHPVDVAGVPPDAFSSWGQKWGNPLYNWDKMKEEDFSWWRKRMASSARIYDVIRFDHFIGCVRYFSIPAEGAPADGEYHEGPGIALIKAIDESLGKSKLIAEDLGVVIPRVTKLLKRSGYPGMKVLEFAFDGGNDNPYLPHNCVQNCVLYAGTHDNDTLLGYYKSLGKGARKYLRSYFEIKNINQLREKILRGAYSTVADTVIFQMQDILGKDTSARMNLPSTLGNNWKWRLQEDEFSPEMVAHLKELTEIYAR